MSGRRPSFLPERKKIDKKETERQQRLWQGAVMSSEMYEEMMGRKKIEQPPPPEKCEYYILYPKNYDENAEDVKIVCLKEKPKENDYPDFDIGKDSYPTREKALYRLNWKRERPN